MRTFLNLISARNKEFYRDKAALIWTVLFPLLLIVGFTFAFSRPEEAVFTLGHKGQAESMAELPSYIERIDYDSNDQAVQRIRHHQLDVFIDFSSTPTNASYNPLSPSSQALRDIIQAQLPDINFHPLEGKAVRYVEWVIPGVLGMNIMFAALFGVGYVIVRYRKNGVLKRLSASPVTPLEFLSAQMVSRFLLVMAANSSILIVCTYALNLRMEGNWFTLILTLAIGCVTMICIGLAVSCRTASEELAGGLLNLFTWPMMVLSEMWFSLDNAPEWMQNLSLALPLTHMVKASRSIMVEGANLVSVMPNLLAMLAFAILSLAIAAKWFRWESA